LYASHQRFSGFDHYRSVVHRGGAVMSTASWLSGQVFQPGQYGLREVISISCNGLVIAHVNANTFANGPQHAKLISAAPDLNDASNQLHDAMLAIEKFLRTENIALPVNLLDQCETACAKWQIAHTKAVQS
jgi:hypothetical protein